MLTPAVANTDRSRLTIGRATVAEQVHQHLRHQLLLGALPPGTRLREAELATTFGVSRTPVREAFRQLQQEGLLASHPTQGVVVRTIGRQEALDAYDLRSELESMGARLAAERASPADKQGLIDLLAEVEASSGADEATQVEADLAFHRRVAELSRNTSLLRALEALEGSITPIKVMTRDQNAVGTTRAQHRAVAEAIHAGRGREAAKAMRTHVNHFRSLVAERFPQGTGGDTAA